MKHFFSGAGVALVTPFTANSEIDFDSLERLVENQITSGIDYLVALGTTAETPALSEPEKKQIVDFIRKKNNKRVPLVAGFGGNNTRKLVEEIKKSDFSEIDAILSVTPYYNKPTQEGMYRHFMEIAECCPVPIILYNVPSRTGINLEGETVVRLATASEKFIAIKEASGNMAQMVQIIKETPSRFILISGDDSVAVPLISLGGKGVISVIANALPDKLSQMIHFSLNSDFESARKLHSDMSELFTLIFREGNPGGIKALMHQLGMLINELRLPLFRVSDKLYHDIAKAHNKMT